MSLYPPQCLNSGFWRNVNKWVVRKTNGVKTEVWRQRKKEMWRREKSLSLVRAGFLYLITIDNLGRKFFLWGRGMCYAVHCRMFSSVPGLYPLAATSDNQTHLQTLPNVSKWQILGEHWGPGSRAKSPLVLNYWSRESISCSHRNWE